LVRLLRRTYDVLAAPLRKPTGFLAGAVGVNLTRGLELVATGVYAWGLADHHRLIRAGLATHAG